MIGETIGSYRIISELGAGAMGQVYLAEHRHLKRKAALKLLARELVDRPDLLERFFLEARATSAIEHPGIVQIFDCEIDATGRPYIVMEHLTGETLAARIARLGPLAPLTVARLARSMAEALGAAHAKDIVHRDLKPENMFVQSEPPDSIKVVDFGIAKLAGELQSNQVHKTRSGALMGTPLYMSPEQCRDSGRIDFRTDLYSLGCVIHEMLTGRPPYLRDNLGDLMVAHLTEPPPDPRALVPGIPAPLAEITMSLLSKDPALRPANMREVAERLMTFVARMTTVPGSASSLGGAGPGAPARASVSATAGPSATTFGASASELVVEGSERPGGRRKTLPLVIAGALVVAAVGVGAFALKTGPQTGTAPPAPSAAALPSPAAALPSPAAALPSPAAANPSPAAALPSPAAAPPVAETPSDKSASDKSASDRKRPAARRLTDAGGRATALGASAAEPTRPGAPEPRTGAAASPPGLSGTWEGPWVDPDNHQKGRFYLQVAANGAVVGWMSNAAAKNSFRMAGTMSPDGRLDLACQCAPQPGFEARGTLHLDGAAELKGQVALGSSAGVFGHSHLTLQRAAPR
jgi:eukaryotic-like serine/threonine-protein kinase